MVVGTYPYYFFPVQKNEKNWVRNCLLPTYQVQEGHYSTSRNYLLWFSIVAAGFAVSDHYQLSVSTTQWWLFRCFQEVIIGCSIWKLIHSFILSFQEGQGQQNNKTKYKKAKRKRNTRKKEKNTTITQQSVQTRCFWEQGKPTTNSSTEVLQNSRVVRDIRYF